jgi:hypothetical protein
MITVPSFFNFYIYKTFIDLMNFEAAFFSIVVYFEAVPSSSYLDLR